MGCTNTRPNLSEEEILLTSWEEVLGFCSNDVRRVDYIIRKHAFGKIIHKNHMNAAIRSLKLRKLNDTEYPHIQDFYKVIETSEGYKFQEFLVIGILFAARPRDKKAKLLFEAFDRNAEDKLNAELLSDLFKMIADICIDISPKLFNDRDELRKAKVQSYLGRLRNDKLQFVSEMVKNVLGDRKEVTKQEFQMFFLDEKYQHFFHTYEIRKTIEKLKKAPPKVNSGEFMSNGSASSKQIHQF